MREMLSKYHEVPGIAPEDITSVYEATPNYRARDEMAFQMNRATPMLGSSVDNSCVYCQHFHLLGAVLKGSGALLNQVSCDAKRCEWSAATKDTPYVLEGGQLNREDCEVIPSIVVLKSVALGADRQVRSKYFYKVEDEE